MVVVAEWCPPHLLAQHLDPIAYRYNPAWADDPAGLASVLADARALVVRNRTLVTAALLDTAPALQVVGRLGTGLDNLDVDALTRRGIAIIAAPGENAVAVAEYVLAAILAANRDLVPAFASTRTRWDRNAHARELAGQTLVLIGLGHVGRAVAVRAAALGLVVVAHDPRLAQDHPAWHATGARRTPRLEDALAQAQWLSLHVPAVPGQPPLLDSASLARLPRGAYVINTARGSLIDEGALLAALQSGQVSGATLDVRELEPPPPDDALRSHPRVQSTPHIAGLTQESQVRIAAGVLGGVRAFLHSHRPLPARSV
ncbi:MAG: NAD(P)-dependent oxidoreductase [Thermaerobacter sp.]|nr:NAD(P)-dependent oxidoreductase [Thermaerobacter sp.]